MAPTSSVRIPAGLAGAVTGVVGLDTRPLDLVPDRDSPHRLRWPPPQGITTDAANKGSAYQPRSGAASGCADGLASGGFTPNQYLTAYGFEPFYQAGLTGTGERVALIEINGFKSSDIAHFAAVLRAADAAESRATAWGSRSRWRPSTARRRSTWRC